MNIYLEDSGFKNNLKIMRTLCDKYKLDSPLSLHMICKRKILYSELVLLVYKCRSIGSIDLIIDIKNVFKSVMIYANVDNFFNVRLVVNEKLNKRLKKKIRKFKREIYLYDFTGIKENEDFYKENEQIAYQTVNENEILKRDSFKLATYIPLNKCWNSSCLGKTLYISKNGDISFCPKNIEKTRIGNIDNVYNLFDNIEFKNCLKKMINKRSNCEKQCQFFQLCKGGCLFENCKEYKSVQECTIKEINDIIETGVDLRSMPNYKKHSVINFLFGGKR